MKRKSDIKEISIHAVSRFLRKETNKTSEATDTVTFISENC